MHIDEEGLLKIKGRKETDHNTITAIFYTSPIQQQRLKKNTVWRLNAPECNWTSMNKDLITLSQSVAELLSTDEPIDKIYNKWYKKIEEIAWKNIGKTTMKNKRAEYFSDVVENTKKGIKNLPKENKKWT